MGGESPGGSVKCSQEEHLPWVRNLGQCFPSFSLGHLLHAAGMVRMQRWEQGQPQAQSLEEGWSSGRPVVLNLTLWPLLRAACSSEKQQTGKETITGTWLRCQQTLWVIVGQCEMTSLCSSEALTIPSTQRPWFPTPNLSTFQVDTHVNQKSTGWQYYSYRPLCMWQAIWPWN